MKLHQVQLLPRVPIILKDLYDADLLEEDVIFAWAEKVTLRTLKDHPDAGAYRTPDALMAF